MTFKTINDFDMSNKVVLLRADLNVPTNDGFVTDATRITRLKDTISSLSDKGARILIVSHFGRPKNGPSPEYSLEFLIPTLSEIWGKPIRFAHDCIGDEVKEVVDQLKPGQICLLENVRFHPEEEMNDKEFAQKLAANADIFVNDAFSAAHRAHASTEGVAHILPTAAGLLMEQELKALESALEKPQRPVAAIVGGAKISTKLELLENLVQKTDMLILGGGMANTFLYAQGYDMKSSLCEKDMADQARKIMDVARASNCEIILPVDGVAATRFAANAENETFDNGHIPDGHMILDIGQKSIDVIKEKLADAQTIVWNGPLGAFEIEPFDNGTVSVAQYVAKLPAVVVAGGGDTVAALEHAGVVNSFTYVSAAGGAFLEWLEGKTLPGVAALCAYTPMAPAKKGPANNMAP
jgi:phosphoglycerate kinase